jgi:molybdate transport system substrate-binding protein
MALNLKLSQHYVRPVGGKTSLLGLGIGNIAGESMFRLFALAAALLAAVEPRADIGQAGLGVAVRAGAPKPDISSVEAFKRSLLAAKAVAYPGEGASGLYFVSLLDRMGIKADMRDKLKPMPAEDTVEVVARGEADMVVVVATRISDVPGVEMVGPIPEALQTKIGFAAGLGASAKEPDAAKALIQFLTAPAAAPTLRAKGVDPI